MTIRTIRFRTLLEIYHKLNINSIKLNSLSIISAIKYTELLIKLIDSGFEIMHLSKDYGFEIMQVPRLAWKKIKRSYQKADTITYGAGSLWKLSVHPLKGAITPFPSEIYEATDETLLLTRTGKIGLGSLIPEGFTNTVKEFFNKEHVIYTEHLLRVIGEDRDLQKYLVLLFNSAIGNFLSNIAWYGALQPELDRKVVERVPIPIAPARIRNKVVSLLSSAYELELKAWRAYFKALKMVEEYFGKTERLITSIVKVKDMHGISRFRVDPSRLLAFGAVSRLVKEHSGKVCRISDLFKVHTAGVPREKKYKIREGQYPLITIDSIDESGIIDYERIYYITRRGAPYPKGSILLVKDGASIGKVGILPYDAYVMQGIAILVPKPNVDESLKYYVLALLKSSFYRKIIEALGYGATVQYSITKDELESLEIPIIEEITDEVSRYMKEFIENMYMADELKRKAISELESYILKFIS